MKIISLLLWIAASLFISPGAMYENTEEDLPRLIMEAADGMVEPGYSMDWEAQRMEEDEDLEITWGAGVEQVKKNLPASEETTGQADGSGTSGENPEEGLPVIQTPITSDTQAAERSIIGPTYSMEQLTNFSFLLENFFCLDPSTTVDAGILNGETMMAKDFTLSEGDDPQVLIYHTHSQEAYADSVVGDQSMTVQGVGDELERILTEKYGLSVLHITDQFDMLEGQIERSRAYSYAKKRLQEILDEYPSIQVIIDLHRDGVREDLHLVTEVDGKPTAKIMFFNGLSQDLDGALERLANPFREDNLSFSLQMRLQADAYYPGYCRDIYLKGYRYNLHFRARSVLLEVGAQNNTFEEAINAMEPFADILAKVVLPNN